MNESVNSNRRPKAWLWATLAMVLVPLLTGCGPAGDEYVGEWSSQNKGGHRLEITRVGESTFTVEKTGDLGYSLGATLNDDGILVVQMFGTTLPLVIDDVSGKLTFDSYEYIRAPDA